MRAAKWALVVLAGMLGILVTILIIGFIYGLVQLGIAAVRSIARRFTRGSSGGSSCTK